MTKLGKIDTTKMLLLSSHLSLPREGHLDAAVHVMAYVDVRYISRLVNDQSYPEIDQSVFQRGVWSVFYWVVKETTSMIAPEPRGKRDDICIFVDSDHA